MIREPHQLAALFDLDNIWRCSESVYVIRAASNRMHRAFQLSIHADGWTFMRTNYRKSTGFTHVAMPGPLTMAVLPTVLLGDIPIVSLQSHTANAIRCVTVGSAS